MFLKNKIKDAVKNPHLILNILKNKILFFYKLYIVKDDTILALAKWFKDEGDKNHRLKYPLTNESIVFDLGGYKGDFAANIYDKYKCYIYVFEPIKKYYLDCVNRFGRYKKIKCFNYGLSNENVSVFISVDNEKSSLIKNNISAHAPRQKKVLIKSFSKVLSMLKVKHIDLLKINVEGSEFLILPEIISKKLINKIKHLQVQFHTFYPNSKKLRDEIRLGLSETHEEEWNYPFVWESWKIKT
jgi:FkbM family methyltransferase